MYNFLFKSKRKKPSTRPEMVDDDLFVDPPEAGESDDDLFVDESDTGDDEWKM